jgi:hypothetical protein
MRRYRVAAPTLAIALAVGITLLFAVARFFGPDWPE